MYSVRLLAAAALTFCAQATARKSPQWLIVEAWMPEVYEVARDWSGVAR